MRGRIVMMDYDSTDQNVNWHRQTGQILLSCVNNHFLWPFWIELHSILLLKWYNFTINLFQCYPKFDWLNFQTITRPRARNSWNDDITYHTSVFLSLIVSLWSKIDKSISSTSAPFNPITSLINNLSLSFPWLITRKWKRWWQIRITLARDNCCDTLDHNYGTIPRLISLLLQWIANELLLF